MSRADEMATRVARFGAEVQKELSALSDAQWVAACEGGAWTVGHTAHHIAESLVHQQEWLDSALTSGAAHRIDPVQIDAENAACLAAHFPEPRTETMALLLHNFSVVVGRVRALSDADLDRPMVLNQRGLRTIADFFGDGGSTHARAHLALIHAAIEG